MYIYLSIYISIYTYIYICFSCTRTHPAPDAAPRVNPACPSLACRRPRAQKVVPSMKASAGTKGTAGGTAPNGAGGHSTRGPPPANTGGHTGHRGAPPTGNPIHQHPPCLVHGEAQTGRQTHTRNTRTDTDTDRVRLLPTARHSRLVFKGDTSTHAQGTDLGGG